MAEKTGDPLVVIPPNQVCKHCNKLFRDNHKLSPLQAVICLHMPNNNCRPGWGQHRIQNERGLAYLSILEQIGMLAACLEECGPQDAYGATMANIQLLVARLAGRPTEQVKPVEEWFLDAKPESGQ